MSKNDVLMKFLRLYFSISSRVASPLAVQTFYYLFHKSFKQKRRPLEVEYLKKSSDFTIPFLDAKSGKELILPAHRWGNVNHPIILFVHGWSGSSTNCIAFIDGLLEKGYQVVSYDTVAHGDSEGKSSYFFQWVESIKAALQKTGHVHCIMAHSLGGGTLTVASSLGLDTDKLVLLAPVNDAVDVVNRFARALSVPQIIVEKMLIQTWSIQNDTASKYGANWQDVFYSTYKVPTLIVHDKNDMEVGIEHGRALAKQWPWAELMETKGLGHRRVLYDKQVVTAVINFISTKNRGG